MSSTDWTRRDFIRTAGLGAASLALTATAATAAAASTGAAGGSRRPNIIYIMADDLGYGDLGCYGQTRIRTPHIDQLASEGVRFTDCYAGCTVCAPSRSVLMTGLHMGHTRVRGNGSSVGGSPDQGRVPLLPEDLTVAEVLKDAGYVTGITGKWGLGEPGTVGIPTRQGFDEWLGYLNQRNAHSYYPPFLWRNEEQLMLEGNADGGQEQYSHDLMTEFALGFIRENRRKPFFLYVPWCIPHDRYEVPDLGDYANEDWPENARIYAAMVARMDRDVGRIMALLSELGLAENTLVFFCSDNGAAQRWNGVLDSSGSLRGNKRDLYEGGIRTPMICRWTGRIQPGTTSDAVWYFPDVLPTLAAVAGAAAPAGIDGINVLPTILGERQDLSDRFLYWEFFERGFHQAVRYNQWKALRKGLDGTLELYDLSTDPGEKRNLAATHPQQVRFIEAYLKTARTPSPEWPVEGE